MGPGTAPAGMCNQQAAAARPTDRPTKNGRIPGPRGRLHASICVGVIQDARGFCPRVLPPVAVVSPQTGFLCLGFGRVGRAARGWGAGRGPSALGHRPADLALHAVSSVPPAGGNLNHRNLKNCNFNENKKRFSSLVFVLKEFGQSNQEMIGGK